MSSEYNHEIYEGMWAFSAKMQDARDKCCTIARTEEVLGYAESASLYEELASELGITKAWVEEQMRAMLRII